MLAVAAVAAGGGGGGGEPAATEVPPVDRSRHTVPARPDRVRHLRRQLRAPDRGVRSQIRSLRDRIRPIDEPRYGSPDELPWLEDGDLVVGYVADGEAYAYPVKVLNFRELVKDELGGRPVVVTYCPLCGSGVVYDRRAADRTLLFGNTSALYEADLVMFDHETGSYWFQVAGEAIFSCESLSALVGPIGR